MDTVGEIELQFFPPLPSSTISYTLAGQKRSQGFPYSSRQRVAHTEVSATFRWEG